MRKGIFSTFWLNDSARYIRQWAGGQIFFDRTDLVTLTFDEKFLYISGKICTVYFILQMVSSSYSIAFTKCLSNSHLFPFWTLLRDLLVSLYQFVLAALLLDRTPNWFIYQGHEKDSLALAQGYGLKTIVHFLLSP